LCELLCSDTRGKEGRHDLLRSCLSGLCAGVQAAARNAGYPTKASAHYSYTNALHKSLIFVETMRSGILPRWRVAWCAADTFAAFHVLLTGCFLSISFVGQATRCTSPRA